MYPLQDPWQAKARHGGGSTDHPFGAAPMIISTACRNEPNGGYFASAAIRAGDHG
jgi:hypothetical protein